MPKLSTSTQLDFHHAQDSVFCASGIFLLQHYEAKYLKAPQFLSTRDSVLNACQQSFSILTGGPECGKTTTVKDLS